MGGNARMAMLTHEERSALGRKPVRAKESTCLRCYTNPSTGNSDADRCRGRALLEARQQFPKTRSLEPRQSMAARVERSRTKTQQMEGTELTLIQDNVVLVECYVQDLMQKKGLLLFKRRGTRRHFL